MPRKKTATKTVVRKYYSKKLGQVITGTYTYDEATKARYARNAAIKRAAKKNATKTTVVKPGTTYGGPAKRAYKKRVISSTGRVYKAGQEFMNKHSSVADQAYIQDIIRKYRTEGNLSKLTVARLTYELTREQIISALDNTGYSFEEIAGQIGTSVEDLTNPANWSGSIYTDPKTGKQYQYQWTYEGTVLNVIN